MDKHVAVLAFPNHATTLVKLAQTLARAAPTTIFSFFNTAEANRSIFSAQNRQGLDNLRSYDVADGVPEGRGHVLSGNPAEGVGLFLKACPGNFRVAMEVAEDEIGRKISCLVSDAFLWFAADIAEELRVPWVVLWNSGHYPLALHIYTDALWDAWRSTGQKTLDSIPALSAAKVEDLPKEIVAEDRESPLACMLHQMGRVLPRATAVATNSFEGLDPTILTDDLKSKLQIFLPVGPFELLSAPSVSDTNGCLPWLDNQKQASVAYISFGRIATPPPMELVALAEALEASGIPFLLSLRENAKGSLPEGFMERTSSHGKVVAWAPQQQVLGHASVGVFITHGGWNSVIESMVWGVPMICRPFFGDHHLNRWMVEEVWGIGVGVKCGVLTKDGVMSGLELVLNHGGKKMREKTQVLGELARRAVQPNGSSTRNFTTLLELIAESQSS